MCVRCRIVVGFGLRSGIRVVKVLFFLPQDQKEKLRLPVSSSGQLRVTGNPSPLEE